MNIGIVTIAYSASGSVWQLIESARMAPHTPVFFVFRHASYPQVIAACERAALLSDVTYFPYGMNRGVSRSWNDGVLAAYAAGVDVVIVANDDITFGPHDLATIAGKAISHREAYIVSCAGVHTGYGRWLPSHGYSCFAINPIALETIGCFDENIFPAYCEDQDYSYRARLAGLSEENCPDTSVTHIGSASIFADAALRRQNALTHGLNLSYYRRKWGGDGGGERFKHPFNDPAFGYAITPERRHAPYGPGYDRLDQAIVGQ